MRSLIKKALTRTITHKGLRGKQQIIKIPPSQKLIYAVYFSISMVACLTVLEVMHLIVLGMWNSEIFVVIAALIGNITGIFLTQKT